MTANLDNPDKPVYELISCFWFDDLENIDDFQFKAVRFESFYRSCDKWLKIIENDRDYFYWLKSFLYFYE